jgi:hypothetical protein
MFALFQPEAHFVVVDKLPGGRLRDAFANGGAEAVLLLDRTQSIIRAPK